MNLRPLLAAAALAAGPPLAAQSAPAPAVAPAPVLTGVVRDADTGAPLPGATVRGGAAAAATDARGHFALAAGEPAPILTVSCVGYQTTTVAARDGAPLDVRLAPATTRLQPVVVAADRTARPRADVPVAVAALTAADLRATRPNSLADALNQTPGVYTVDLGNEQHAMSIRQPFSYKPFFQYVEDGVALRPSGLFNHNALIEVNAAAIEQIEIVRGPGSALWGAGAIGGAVHVTTPTAATAAPFAASVRHAATGLTRADVQAAATAGDVGLVATAYGMRQRGGVRSHSDADKASLTLRADGALADATRWTATASVHRLVTDTDGALDSLSFVSGRRASLQTFTDRTVRAARAAVRVDHRWPARGRLAQRTEATVFGRANAVGQTPHYRLRLIAADPSRAHGEVNEQAFTSLGAQVQHELAVGRLRVLAGGLADRSPSGVTARYIAVDRDPATGTFTGYTATDSLLTDYRVRVVGLAAFVQAEVEALPRLRVVGSLRGDRVGYALDNALPPGAFSGAADRTDAFARWTPRVGAVWAPAPDRGLYVNASQGFLPPEATELYRGVQVPALRPAAFSSYEAGAFAQLAGGRLALDLAAYTMEGRDEIVTVRQADGTSQDRNAGRTRHAGVEWALAAAPVRALAVRLGGTLARHTFVSFVVDERPGREVRYDGRAMDLAPSAVATGEVTLRPVAGVRLAAEAQHVGPYWMDPAHTRRYGGHTLVHLRAQYSGRALGGAEAWIALMNATDARHATIATVSFGRPSYTPGLPRAVTIGLGYRLPRP